MNNTAPTFRISNIEVLAADVHLGDETPHPVRWEINFTEQEPEGHRYIAGWFHAAGNNAQVTVSVGGVLQQIAADSTQEDISRALLDDIESLNTLYEKSKTAAQVMLALTSSDLEIPSVMPPPNVEPFPPLIDEELAQGGMEHNVYALLEVRNIGKPSATVDLYKVCPSYEDALEVYREKVGEPKTITRPGDDPDSRIWVIDEDATGAAYISKYTLEETNRNNLITRFRRDHLAI